MVGQYAYGSPSSVAAAICTTIIEDNPGRNEQRFGKRDAIWEPKLAKKTQT
jgi:hypothetical protein